MQYKSNINSIKVLIRTLAEENELYKENSDLYQQLISDLNVYRKNYETWWNSTCEKYSLDSAKQNQYYLDFETKTIFLTGC